MANSEYLEMIELPVSTCEMVTPQKKKKFFKGKLIRNVNKKVEKEQKNSQIVHEELNQNNEQPLQEQEEVKPLVFENSNKAKQRPKFKLDLVGAEVIAIFVLVVAILLTNIFWEDSGINTMIRNVFGTAEQVQTDDRQNTAFACVSPTVGSDVTVENGVMNIGKNKAVYPPYQGVITKSVEKDGLYTITISHSDVFYSVISGVEFVYAGVGDKVYNNIPVAISPDSGAQVAMYNGGNIITNFTIDNGNIVWQS